MAKYPFTKICEHCSNNFLVSNSSRRHQKFCNPVCYKKAVKNPNQLSSCARCNKPLGRHQKMYCSQSCAAITNNHAYPKRKKKIRDVKPKVLKVSKRPKILKDNLSPKVFNCVCAHCGVKFVTSKQRKYCNSHRDCYSHKGRARYWFSINVFKYPDLFDLEALKKIGFRSRENPDGYTRDHKVSVNEAIRHDYDPYYIKHVMNCELMLWPENNKKNTKSSITYEELVKMVDEYDRKNISSVR